MIYSAKMSNLRVVCMDWCKVQDSDSAEEVGLAPGPGKVMAALQYRGTVAVAHSNST